MILSRDWIIPFPVCLLQATGSETTASHRHSTILYPMRYSRYSFALLHEQFRNLGNHVLSISSQDWAHFLRFQWEDHWKPFHCRNNFKYFSDATDRNLFRCWNDFNIFPKKNQGKFISMWLFGSIDSHKKSPVRICLDFQSLQLAGLTGQVLHGSVDQIRKRLSETTIFSMIFRRIMHVRIWSWCLIRYDLLWVFHDLMLWFSDLRSCRNHYRNTSALSINPVKSFQIRLRFFGLGW